MRNILIALLISISCGVEALPLDSDAYKFLDNLAIEAGADKSSKFHNYTKIYSQYFAGFRTDTFKFLEIGIYKGNSVKMWEAYFPNADLYFIDITPNAIEYYSERSQYFFIDQSNAALLNEFAKNIEGGFDVIIDDGGHTMEQQIVSMKTLFPYLKSGGMYIIEDLHTSYWKQYGGGGTLQAPYAGKKTAIQFLKNKIDSLNAVGAKTGKANFDLASPAFLNTLNSWEKEILSMHFYDSVCIIFKR